MLFVMSVDARNGIDMGAIVRSALHDCDMQHKEAWIAGGYPNASQFAKALNGDAPLDLWRMRDWPLKFWQTFIPKLATALIQQFWSEKTGEFHMARATEQPQDERKRA